MYGAHEKPGNSLQPHFPPGVGPAGQHNSDSSLEMQSNTFTRAVAIARRERARGVKQSGLTPQQLSELQTAFNIFDQDGSGSIDATELRTAMKAIGFNVTKDQVVAMIAQIDLDGGGTVSFDEFVQLVFQQAKSKDVEQESGQAFKMFLHAGGDPQQPAITFAHLQRVRDETAEAATDEDLQAMIEIADQDESGDVNLQEFTSLMKKTGVFRST